MALKNSQYYALMREYEQTRLKNHDIQMKRYEEVYKKLPEFQRLKNLTGRSLPILFLSESS